MTGEWLLICVRLLCNWRRDNDSGLLDLLICFRLLNERGEMDVASDASVARYHWNRPSTDPFHEIFPRVDQTGSLEYLTLLT